LGAIYPEIKINGASNGQIPIAGETLNILRRILLTLTIAAAIIFATVQWIAPVALSFYASRKAPSVARVVPVGLRDQSVSQNPGRKLSYFGYEFELPWSDLDETQTRPYPKDKPKSRVDLHFRSGLRLLVTSARPQEFVDGLAEEMKVPPQTIESSFGSSDYQVIKTIFEFTPVKMNHWSLSARVRAREEFLLLMNSIVPTNSANSGIFNVQNKYSQGFQEGDPRVRPDGILVHLFCRQGSIEFIFVQKDYHLPEGITQREINRIIQSVRPDRQDATGSIQVVQSMPTFAH
jgi:hypothetical protein